MGSAHLYRVGRIWYGWAYDLGNNQHRFSCRTADREVAKEVLRARAKQLVDPDHKGAPPSHTVSDALTYFLDHGIGDKATETQAFYRKKAGTLTRLMGETQVQDLSEALVREYTTQRLREQVSHHTVNKEMVTLRQALKLARKRRDLALKIDVGEVVPHYDPHYAPRTRRLTTGEFARLLGQFEARRRLWLMVAVYGGGRLSEINRLDWDRVDLSGGFIRWGTKTKASPRVVPIHPVLSRELRGVPRGMRSGLVCEWRNPASGLASSCRTLGIPHASPNDLRRTFISWMKEAGVESFAVAKLAGHASSKMIDQVYGHLSTKVYREAIKTLPVVGYRSDKPARKGGTGGTGEKRRMRKRA